MVSNEKEANYTGLPNKLRSGVENLSGFSMDDVHVRYNSSKPAQLQALAYTRGTDIYVAPGQEQNLPHEAWHVVQQMEGRVKPTMQMKGLEINNDAGLEREADEMGEKALNSGLTEVDDGKSMQMKEEQRVIRDYTTTDTIQRAVGFEFETPWRIDYAQLLSRSKKFLFGWLGAGLSYTTMAKYQTAYTGDGWKLTADCSPNGSVIEFVTEHVDETTGLSGHNRLCTVMTDLTRFANRLNDQNNNARFTLDRATGNLADEIYRISIPDMFIGHVLAANPQASVGIRLERIGILGQAVNTPEAAFGTARQDLMGMDNGIWGTGFNRYYQHANTAVNNLDPNLRSERLKGLITLIISYIIEGAPLIGFSSDQCCIEYAKHITILMARTKFSSMYNTLPQNVKEYFATDNNRWGNLIWNAVNRENTRNFNANDRMGLAGFLIERSIARDGVTFFQPHSLKDNLSRLEWINGIKDGIDLSSKFDPSMGNLSKMDNVGPGQLFQAPILEFRKMGEQIGYEDWTPLALRIYDYITALNNYTPGAGNPPNY